MEERQKAKDALQNKDMEITNLKVKAEADKSAAVLHEQSIKEQYENKLNFAQQQVEYYKDLKSKMSTKMVGETLELDRIQYQAPLFPAECLLRER